MRWIIVLVLISVTNPGIAANCDCTIYPFNPDPPCFDVCTAKHLSVATASELTTIVRVDQNIARLIARIPENQRPPTLEGYKQFLTEKQFSELKKALMQLNGKGFDAIRQRAATRGKPVY
ncbi:MAG: hypothetical protein ABIC39_00895 [Pseudomonadota bacterium]